MMAPFYKFGLFGEPASLIVAFVTGIGFGFFLERAGFGNARILAAQFYFRNLRVLKVMFTAIVTAMVGLYFLSRIGFVDLSLVYLVPTFLVPQVVGGIILGVGFVIGGYCPGTSCVAAATGRVDGMVYLLGMFAGLFGFAEAYPHLEGFAHSTAMGQITLPRLFDIPYGLVVFAVVVMALGAFVAAEWAETKFGHGSAAGGDSLLGGPWKLTPVRRFALVLGVLGLVAAVAGNPYRGSRVTMDTRELAIEAGRGADQVSSDQLADWIVQGTADFRLVDLRGEPKFAQYHIPSAQNVPLASLSPDFAARNEKIILYSGDGVQAAQAWFILKASGFSSVYLLRGGMEEWRRSILFPSEPKGATPAESIEFARRCAVSKFFGGTPQAGAGTRAPEQPKLAAPVLPTAPPPQPSAAPKPKPKREGC